MTTAQSEWWIADKITGGHEGLYANDPKDPGGETWAGVSRVFNPTELLWFIIDDTKRKIGFPRRASVHELNLVLGENKDLANLVDLFYKRGYWDVFRGDLIPSQPICDELYDTGVNMGVGRSTRFLQTVLNAINRNQYSWPNITVDGAYGNQTHGTFLKALDRESNERLIFKMLNCRQGDRYIDRMGEREDQEKYARGWFDRVMSFDEHWKLIDQIVRKGREE